MKSKLKILTSILLCLVMSVFMYGCNEEPQYFDVSVNVWYSNYGTAYGSGTFEENTTCTIYATEKQNSTFLAWMHNNVIVSYESTYSFTVTNQTRGTYTAIFTSPSMDLVTPKTATVNNTITSSYTINSINMVMSIGSRYSSLHQLINEDITQNNQFTITEPVLALDSNNSIYCEVALTFVYETVIQNETTQVEANTTTALQINLNDLMTGELNLNLPNIMQGSLTMNIEFETFTGAPESEDTEDTTN